MFRTIELKPRRPLLLVWKIVRVTRAFIEQRDVGIAPVAVGREGFQVFQMINPRRLKVASATRLFDCHHGLGDWKGTIHRPLAFWGCLLVLPCASNI